MTLQKGNIDTVPLKSKLASKREIQLEALKPELKLVHMISKSRFRAKMLTLVDSYFFAVEVVKSFYQLGNNGIPPNPFPASSGKIGFQGSRIVFRDTPHASMASKT